MKAVTILLLCVVLVQVEGCIEMSFSSLVNYISEHTGGSIYLYECIKANKGVECVYHLPSYHHTSMGTNWGCENITEFVGNESNNAYDYGYDAYDALMSSLLQDGGGVHNVPDYIYTYTEKTNNRVRLSHISASDRIINTVKLVFLPIIIIIGTVLNVMAFVIFSRPALQGTTTSFLIKTLAVTDMMMKVTYMHMLNACYGYSFLIW